MNRPVASTSVLITGPEITAGSIFNRAASGGSSEPITLAHSTIVNRDALTVSDSAMLDPQVRARTKPTAPMSTPSRKPVRISCHSSRQVSLSFTSPTAMARMIVLVACEPELPPVPISSGTKKDSATAASSSCSKKRITVPVSISVRNSTISQPTRFRVTVSTGVLRYSVSNG